MSTWYFAVATVGERAIKAYSHKATQRYGMHSALSIRDFLNANDKNRRLMILQEVASEGPVSALEFAERLGADDSKDAKTIGRVFTYLRDNKLLEWHRNESHAVVANRCQLTRKAIDFVGEAQPPKVTRAAKPKGLKAAEKSDDALPAFISVADVQQASVPAPTHAAAAPAEAVQPAKELPGYLPPSLTTAESAGIRAGIFGRYLEDSKTARELAAVLGLSVKTTNRLLELGLQDGTILGSDDEERRFILTRGAPKDAQVIVADDREEESKPPVVAQRPSTPEVQLIPARKRRQHKIVREEDTAEDPEVTAELEAFMRQPAILLHKEQVRQQDTDDIEPAPVDNAPILNFLASLSATVSRLRTASGTPLSLRERDDLQEQFGRYFAMAKFGALVMPRTLFDYIKMSKLADEVAKKVVDLGLQFGVVEPAAADSAAVQKFKLKGVYRNLPPAEAIRTALQRIDGVRTAGNRRNRRTTVWVSGSASRVFAR